MQNYIVFTDLDGTLLNHADYSYDEAKPMLHWLKQKGIPVVFTTSKTAQECRMLQHEMGLKDPYIVENGAAICQGEQVIEMLGVPYSTIKGFIDRYKERFGIVPFSDMSVEEVMARTGFGYVQAKIAKEREYSEPFLMHDEGMLDALKACAAQEGFKILKGGRFYHCVGSGQDKGEAVRRLMKRYPERVSIGLGDNYNDIAMLDVVDIAVLIPHYAGQYIEYAREGLIKASHQGSQGWRESLEKVFDVTC